MSPAKQIFQANSKWRWRTFKWATRVFFLALILTVPVVIFSLTNGKKPDLPLLVNENDFIHLLSNPVIPAGLNKKETKKYKGFLDVLMAGKKKINPKNNPSQVDTRLVRAAFYVDWDPQSFYSLQKNIDKLNMVLPEWFFIDPSADTLS